MSDSPMDQSTETSQPKSQLIKIDLEEVVDGKSILEVRIPSNYRPDLTDESYRPKHLDAAIYHKLGQGSTAIAAAALREVKGAFGTRTEKVVLKKYNIEGFNHNQASNGYTSVLREFQNLQYLTHDNIVELKDSFWSFGKEEILTHVWIVTERMDMTLSDFFRQRKRKDNTETPERRDHRQIGFILVQILQALDYLHQRGIMHRDVKSDNIGINRQFELKLYDFGVSKPINTEGFTTNATTPLYLPLEVHLGDQYDWGVDIWATGLVALEFLNHPFHPANVVNSLGKIKQRILDVFGVPGDKYKEFFENRLMNEKPRDGIFDAFLTTACKRFGPARLDLNEVNFRDLLSKMLCINPRRPLARKLLEHQYLKQMNAQHLEAKKNKKQKEKESKNTLDDHETTRNERDKKTLIKTLKHFSTQL